MKPKIIPIQISAEAQSPTHLKAKAGTHAIDYDKSEANGGTNIGPSPIHSFIASLSGCTYVLLGIVSKEMGLKIANVKIDLDAQFNPSQLMGLSDDNPVPQIDMTVKLDTDATPEQIETLKKNVTKRCPVASVMHAAGVTINETWIAKTL